jgi:site-specific DNA-cytosine methylase
MRVLVACEYSGAVRDAFLRAGHYAMSCDLLPCESLASGDHYQGDVRDVLDHEWDLMVAHPPCTYLSVSGMHWTRRGLRDPQLTEDALAFVRLLLEAPVPRIALENPISIISSRIRKPDQIVQPWQFGHDASKKTCLWLKNLPLLRPTQIVEPRIINGRKRWGNQTDSGQNKLGPSVDRWKIRSATYAGIAQAMVDQWGDL